MATKLVNANWCVFIFVFVHIFLSSGFELVVCVAKNIHDVSPNAPRISVFGDSLVTSQSIFTIIRNWTMNAVDREP